VITYYREPKNRFHSIGYYFYKIESDIPYIYLEGEWRIININSNVTESVKCKEMITEREFNNYELARKLMR
jgi:hypothetical protein